MKFQIKPLLGTALVALAIGTGATHFSSFKTQHPEVYPDPMLTPGLIATTDFKELTTVSACGTYSACHRKTTQAMKIFVCKEYHSDCKGIEIDHDIPLALGGADDIRNLSVQQEHILINGVDYGFHMKDKIEAYLVTQMKKGNILPKDAQNCLRDDWVDCYNRYIGTQLLGNVKDPDGN